MVVSQKALSYYEQRSKRLAENQKKLEELKLGHLYQALRKPIAPKPSPMKKLKPRLPVDLSSVRRPPPDYKEVPLEGLEKPRRYGYKRRDLSKRVNASDEDRENAHDRAEELQSGLVPHIPSFVKPILQSHVTGEFRLELPVEFCKTYMPKRDEIITLVDEKGEVFLTKYLALKAGLSAGWRGFAIEHELVDGDVLVFQMIKGTRLKVYIIRVNQAWR